MNAKRFYNLKPSTVHPVTCTGSLEEQELEKEEYDDAALMMMMLMMMMK